MCVQHVKDGDTVWATAPATARSGPAPSPPASPAPDPNTWSTSPSTPTPPSVEDQIKKELSQTPSENVIVDPQNMSPQALADVKQLGAAHPEWNGKVAFL